MHSDVDRGARHVREIGESIELAGGYLDIDAVLAAARKAGADALHPGYGFLAENAAFARAVEAARLTFIGPSAETIERIGDKARAKRAAARLGLPVIQGSDGGERRLLCSSPHCCAPPCRAAESGRRRRRARHAVIDRPTARGGASQRAARSERRRSATARSIVERYLPRVRHIEVQIAGDGRGGASICASANARCSGGIRS